MDLIEWEEVAQKARSLRDEFLKENSFNPCNWDLFLNAWNKVKTYPVEVQTCFIFFLFQAATDELRRQEGEKAKQDE
jgi:hypothetical protein